MLARGSRAADWTLLVQVGKIGGLDAYFAEPKASPKAGVMLIHDIHGWDKKNIRMVADKYADAGMRLVGHVCPVGLVTARTLYVGTQAILHRS